MTRISLAGAFISIAPAAIPVTAESA